MPSRFLKTPINRGNKLQGGVVTLVSLFQYPYDTILLNKDISR